MKKHVLTVICILIALAFCTRLLTPKYMEGVTEGAFVAEYYDAVSSWPEEMQKAASSGDAPLHDVLFFGDCEVYNNIATPVLWRDFGINAFIRGTPQQTMWQTYYLMEETFTYETPRVVVLSVFAMQYNEPQSEIYNRMTLDRMKWSRAKRASIRASMTPDEHYVEYVFPLLRFHDRWKQLERQDLTYFASGHTVTYNGYDLRTGVSPVSTLPSPLPLTDARFGEHAYDYLNRIVTLCNEHGTELILLKAPSLYPHWYDEWDEQITAYAKEHGLRYINLLAEQDAVGLDFQTDTYDGGLHLNVDGAEKTAAYLGAILQTEYDIPDRRSEDTLTAMWKETLSAYENAKRP